MSVQMSRQISVKRYQRRFCRPLRTARGEWAIREGFLLRVEEAGQIGFGEVAPLPEFGTETVSAAEAFLEELVQEPELKVPGSLPCCAFGISVAGRDTCPQASAQNPAVLTKDYAISALLPAGSVGQGVAAGKIKAGYTSLKWKIGLQSVAKEQAAAVSLLDSLPQGVTLRLDANASLSIEELDSWLKLLANHQEQIDYLEQPLAVGKEVVMAERMADTGISIALDESLNGKGSAQWLEAGVWAGPLVIKAPLMGDVHALAEKLKPLAGQIVFSSVFETGVGLQNTLSLADLLCSGARPIGYDTFDAFDDELTPLESAPFIRAEARSSYTAEQIWNLI